MGDTDQAVENFDQSKKHWWNLGFLLKRFLLIAVILITLFIGALVGISFYFSANKDAVSNAISHAYNGAIVHMEEPADILLFPKFRIVLPEIKVWHSAVGVELFSIRRLHVERSLMNHIFGVPGFQVLDIQELRLSEFMTGLPDDVFFESIKPEEEKLVLKGAYGSAPFVANIDIKKRGGENAGFVLDNAGTFHARLEPRDAAPYILNAKTDAGAQSLALKGIVLKHGEKKVLEGHAYLSSADTTLVLKGPDLGHFFDDVGQGKAFDITLSVNTGGDARDIDTTIKLGESDLSLHFFKDGIIDKAYHFSGFVQSDHLNLQDIWPEEKGGRKTRNEQGREVPGFAQEPIKDAGFQFMKGTVDIDIADLKSGDKQIGALHAVLSIKDGHVMLASKGDKSRLYNGVLEGSLKLDVTQSPSKFNSKVTIQDFQLTQPDDAEEGLQKASPSDFVWLATSEGETMDEMIAGLDGETTFVMGQGRLWDDRVNILGKDMLFSLLPSLGQKREAVMNCAVAAFAIKNGIATSEGILIDTNAVTITGEGTINFPENKIAISLNPEPKGSSVLSMASRLNVSGPIGDPSIGPDALGLGQKIGGLVLGSINPIAGVVSMVDLGLSDQHPCRKYFKDGPDAQNDNKD